MVPDSPHRSYVYHSPKSARRYPRGRRHHCRRLSDSERASFVVRWLSDKGNIPLDDALKGLLVFERLCTFMAIVSHDGLLKSVTDRQHQGRPGLQWGELVVLRIMWSLLEIALVKWISVRSGWRTTMVRLQAQMDHCGCHSPHWSPPSPNPWRTSLIAAVFRDCHVTEFPSFS